MTFAAKAVKDDLRAIAGAWKTLRSHTRIGVIGNNSEYLRMSEMVDRLLDVVGDSEDHQLSGLLDVLGTLIERYEETNVSLPKSSPKDVLRFLMEQHGLRQADLRSELGSQGVASEVLSGKRPINARQAKALAERFRVSAAVFL